MTLEVIWTSQFRRDYKRMMKRGRNISVLDDTIRKLANCELLPPKFHDHELTGKWRDFRECHIAPGWLLIYRIANGALTLTLSRTGTHSELFN